MRGNFQPLWKTHERENNNALLERSGVYEGVW